MNTPGIGHNSPPAFDAFSMALDDAYATAKDFLDGQPIENQGQADAVGRILSEVKKIKRDADAARADEKAPHLAASRAVDAKWKPLDERAATIIAAAQKPLTAYLNKLAKKQAEAERKAREEAERKAAEARKAVEEADSLEALERTKILDTAAEQAAKDAKRAGRAKAHVAGMDRAVGLRTYQIAEVTNRRQLLEHVMRHDPEALTDWLAEYARKALPSQLPGVTIRTERRVA